MRTKANITWLRDAVRRGWHPDSIAALRRNIERQQLGVAIRSDLFDRLKGFAREEGTSMAAVVELLIEEGLP